MAIIWNSSFETGIRQVDLQHQELIELINELGAAHASGQDAVALKNILPRLTAYALFHFNEEEAIAACVASGTAHEEQHLAEHRNFAAKIAGLKFDQPEDTSQAVADLVAFLQTWLIEHIMQTDKQLAHIYHARQRMDRERRGRAE